MKNNYIKIIYGGIIRHKKLSLIHKELYDSTINKKVVDAKLLTFAGKVAKKLKKHDKGEGNYYGGIGLVVLADVLVDEFITKGINDGMNHLINSFVTKKAEEEKEKNVLNDIKSNRKDHKIFYLASSHNDCAKDHKDYQGKMYIDEKWDKLIDENLIKRVKKYINKHNVKTIQWVMGKPAWFITRPNCRHYLQSIKTEDVLRKSVKSLKRKYKTHNKEGDRDFQTPREATLEKYYERLRTLMVMYNQYPTEKLKKMIEKTKMLIERYKNQ